MVGRTGVLTPVAELRPVELAGSTISRATLHNAEQIARQDIRIGDHVWLVKAGDVIPAIESSIPEKRTGAEKVFAMPASCPVCGGEARFGRRRAHFLLLRVFVGAGRRHRIRDRAFRFWLADEKRTGED